MTIWGIFNRGTAKQHASALAKHGAEKRKREFKRRHQALRIRLGLPPCKAFETRGRV